MTRSTSTRSTEPRADVYTRVTDQIVAALESGVRPWQKPWTAASGDAFARPLRQCGTPYQGVNVILLWSQAITKGYTSPYWMTYKQAEAHGAHVRKGEKGSLVVYANAITKTETNEAGDDVEKRIPFMKAYTVFNVEQIDGLPAKYQPTLAPARDPITLLAEAETFFAATGAIITHGGDRAYYQPQADAIRLPAPEAFVDGAAYAATKAHELVHWTGHASRLDRTLSTRFGNDQYAVEELIAELGAAFLCADLAISAEPREDHASYLAHWIKVLKTDKRAIFTAASAAQKAADFLHTTAAAGAAAGAAAVAA